MKKTTAKNGDSSPLNSKIFTQIYEGNYWGGKAGEYYSGPGSHNEYIFEYADKIASFIIENNIKNIVEIGCGDFNVTRQILNLLDRQTHRYHYKGYDVVDELILKNRDIFGSDSIKFFCKDSCTGKIAKGDLLVVRQVMQHLCNKSIGQILSKFNNYKFVIFTEHQASDKYNELIIPNLDIHSGAWTRLNFRSGVYLDKEPFNLKIDSILHSIKEETAGLDAEINTYLIKN